MYNQSALPSKTLNFQHEKSDQNHMKTNWQKVPNFCRSYQVSSAWVRQRLNVVSIKYYDFAIVTNKHLEYVLVTVEFVHFSRFLDVQLSL